MAETTTVISEVTQPAIKSTVKQPKQPKQPELLYDPVIITQTTTESLIKQPEQHEQPEQPVGWGGKISFFIIYLIEFTNIIIALI